MKKLLANLLISKVIYGIILVINLCLPLTGQIMDFDLFQIIIVLIWTYGVLSHHGYFKTQVSDESEGTIKYEPNTPILQIILLRFLEFVYLWFTQLDVVNWKIFAGLVLADTVYVGFLLMDKATYVFEMDTEEDDGTD